MVADHAKNQGGWYTPAMDSSPLPVSSVDERDAALRDMVLSASGWRTVFGGGDDALTTAISVSHRDLVALAADVYAEDLQRRGLRTVAVATDTRPTGPAIADTAIRAFLTRGLQVRWLGIAAAPEIMAWVADVETIDAFFYVSASHNPPGHNGFKMGYGDGAVMPGSQANPLIAAFRAASTDQKRTRALVEAIGALPPEEVQHVIDAQPRWKAEALAAYRAFALRCGAASMEPETFSRLLREALRQRPLGIVAELNGSARSVSVDRALLPELGVATALHNDTPGVFAHQILPEGAGLESAARLLERYAADDPRFRVAYVPDNDGDRGNLVFMGSDGSAHALDAQTVFALVVMTELAWTRYLEDEHDATFGPLAVVANGPTSIRIDDICTAFGAEIHRAEVGEANVVSRAAELTADGFHVVILGEGSNGGNITPPARVRDPLNTLQALLKLHAFHLDRVWRATSTPDVAGADNGPEPELEPAPDGGFFALAATLPAFTTLATDDPRAKMQIGGTSHRDLKARYEAALPERIAPLLDILRETYGTAVRWEIENYEGTARRLGAGNRSGEERGGLRVVFTAGEGRNRPLAAVWMRGSGTEPVFRILADCRGDRPDLLDRLVEWQREAVAAAVGL